MTEQMIRAGEAELCVETFGEAGDPAVLLIAGVAMSMDAWPPDFCRRIAGAGRFVIRYDHRDTGRSSTAPAGEPDYSALDLFTDPLRIQDALGVDRAHLVGLSMGGAIAQVMAHLHPDRVASLTLISTSPAGERSSSDALPGPVAALAEHLREPGPDPDWDDRAAVIDYIVEDYRHYAGTLGFDEQSVRRVTGQTLDRTRDIAAGRKNHWIAAAGGESPSFRLADLPGPALILHGTADPLFPLPHGEALAAEIPGATFVPLEGMGHEVPPPALWDLVVPAIVEHTA
ncbi:MAG TPA: alpha/beta hydrolase [Mycobacteriales bacterium]|nr:alpha/beta hydrolase [Mycobacteriales bacterium]